MARQAKWKHSGGRGARSVPPPELRAALQVAHERTDRAVLAQVTAGAGLGLKPGAAELIMLTLRREGRVLVNGTLVRVREDRVDGLASISGVEESDRLFATARTLRQQADEVERQKPGSGVAKRARTEASRAERTADDSVLNVALMAWLEESERTGSVADRERFNQLLRAVRERSHRTDKERAKSRKGGLNGRGTRKRPHSAMIQRLETRIAEKGAHATPALIRGGLSTEERWRSLANDSEPIDEIEDVTVRGSTVEFEYSEGWARRHGRSPTVIVTKDTLKKRLRTPKRRSLP